MTKCRLGPVHGAGMDSQKFGRRVERSCFAGARRVHGRRAQKERGKRHKGRLDPTQVKNLETAVGCKQFLLLDLKQWWLQAVGDTGPLVAFMAVFRLV